MATIYDMSTGTIVSENTGITTIKNHTEFQEFGVALQLVPQTPSDTEPSPCDAYMSLLQELLKQL
jgi:hypothetical protein